MSPELFYSALRPLACLWQKCGAMKVEGSSAQQDITRNDDDPLQEFVVEMRPPTVHLSESKQDVQEEVNQSDAAPQTELLERLAGAELLVERIFGELEELKSGLATLVASVEDIKKQQHRLRRLQLTSRRAELPAHWSRAVAAAAAIVTCALVAWAASSLFPSGIPDAPIEAASEPPAAGTPGAAIVPATVEVTSAAGAAGASPARVTPAAPGAPPASEERRSRPFYVGTLTVDSAPAGEVFLNRKKVGRTPVRLENLRAGSHLIWVERDGYRRWTRVVPVAANRISRVTADLDPAVR